VLEFKKLEGGIKDIKDRIYYGDLFPPLGSFQISYARLLQLLAQKKIKRLVLLSDGRTAVVEVPVENTETDFKTVTYDRRNLKWVTVVVLSFACFLCRMSIAILSQPILLPSDNPHLTSPPLPFLFSFYLYCSIQYAEEVPEWKMEKNRYYCEIPGDMWEEGLMMRLIKQNQEKRVLEDGRYMVPYSSLLRLNQVRPELQVVDPGNA
jgi:hypothetical protein